MKLNYLSTYYDHILGDDDGTQLYVNYLKDEIEFPLLEVACGTGHLLAQLTHTDQYSVGLDLDYQMLSQAIQHAPQIHWFQADMRNFDLHEQFASILCVGDSLNYLPLPEVFQTLEQMDKHLLDHGKMIIDLHHPFRLKEFVDPFIEEGVIHSQLFYQWTIASDHDQLVHTFHFFDDYGHLLDEQMVQQYVHLAHPVLKWFQEHGYHVEYNQDFGLPVKAEGEKIFVLARKGEKV